MRPEYDLSQIVGPRLRVPLTPEEMLKCLKRRVQYNPNWTANQLLRKLGKDMNWLRQTGQLNPEQMKRLSNGELIGDVIQ